MANEILSIIIITLNFSSRYKPTPDYNKCRERRVSIYRCAITAWTTSQFSESSLDLCRRNFVCQCNVSLTFPCRRGKYYYPEEHIKRHCLKDTFRCNSESGDMNKSLQSSISKQQKEKSSCKKHNMCLRYMRKRVSCHEEFSSMWNCSKSIK